MTIITTNKQATLTLTALNCSILNQYVSFLIANTTVYVSIITQHVIYLYRRNEWSHRNIMAQNIQLFR
jgi:hypothetical protein